jgi:hypothetical protein
MADLRQTGKYGQVYLPSGSGVLVSNQALTKSASKEIGGVTYTNQFYGTTGALWNKGKDMSVRIPGIIGDLSLLTPGTANSTVDMAATSIYLNNSSTSATAISAQAGLVLTRPTSSTLTVVNLVVVNTGTKAASVVVGSEAAARSASFNTAGGYPYVAVDEIIVGAVVLTTVPAAVVAASEIEYTLYGTNTLVQERSDIPGYEILPAEGGVLVQEALIGAHTAGATRGVYATYYDLQAVLLQVADTTKWSLSSTVGTVSMLAQGDLNPQTDLAGSPTWSGSLERFYVKDSLLFKLAMEQKRGIIKLFPNRNEPTKYYLGSVVFATWGHTCDNAAAQTQPLSFTGDGPLKAVGF